MINKIEYSFNLTLDTSYWYDVPAINIKTYPENIPEDAMLEIELMQLSWEYIKEIVQELEEVIAWTRDDCMFWFETTNIVVLKKGCVTPNGQIYPNWLVYIIYDYWEKELDTDIPIEDILKMMKDWRDYIESWEKKTGKKYNGI